MPPSGYFAQPRSHDLVLEPHPVIGRLPGDTIADTAKKRGSSMLHAAAIRHAFGLQSDAAANLHFADDNTVMYPVGHCIVVHKPQKRVQKFVPGKPDSQGFSCTGISANRKLFAIAEIGEKAAMTVMDLTVMKKRRVLHSTPEADCRDCTCLTFSACGKLLAALGGGPHQHLMLWQWEKARMVDMVKAGHGMGHAIAQVQFSLGESKLLSVVGDGVLRTFSTADHRLDAVSMDLAGQQPGNNTCMAWLDNNGVGDWLAELLAVGTCDGTILLLQDGAKLVATATATAGSPQPLVALVAVRGGFAAATANCRVSLHIRDSMHSFQEAASCALEASSIGGIHWLAASPDGRQLALTTDSKQILSCTLPPQQEHGQQLKFNTLCCTGHSKTVTGLSTCVRKPHIATCSLDKTIRIWNWKDHTLDLAHTFQDEVYSVSMHPNGMLILAAFSDNLQLLSVLTDDLKLVREFGIKGCKTCSFSHGGGMFAAVYGNLITVYSTYTCECIGNLYGHSGKVTTITWNPDETRLISAGMDGAVYEWRLSDMKRSKEFVHKGCQYNSSAISAEGEVLYATGSDRLLKEFDESAASGRPMVALKMNTLLTKIVVPSSGRELYAATESGAIRAFRFPFPEVDAGATCTDYQQLRVNTCGITQLQVLHDNSALFTAGEDGSVFLFELREADVRESLHRPDTMLPYAEEVLVTKGELEERKQMNVDLEQEVNELMMQNEYQQRIKDMELQDGRKLINERYMTDLDAERQKLEMLVQEKLVQEMEYEEQLKAAEATLQQQLSQLDTLYQHKIMGEVEKYQQLVKAKEAMSIAWEDQMDLLVDSHETVIHKLTEEYEGKLMGAGERYRMLMDSKGALQKEADETRSQLEEDTDHEIEVLKERYEAQLACEKDGRLQLKGENGILKKKFNQLSKDMEDQRDEMRSLFRQKKELYETISKLEREVVGLKKDIREKDESLAEREKRIYDLKRKNQELEKFKFVLDFEIKQLKMQIEPCDQELASMKGRTQEMDMDLEQCHYTNVALDQKVAKLQAKKNDLREQLTSQRIAKLAMAGAVKDLQHDLQEVVAYIQQPALLQERVLELFRKHGGDDIQVVSEHGENDAECWRHKQYLEGMVTELKTRVEDDTKIHWQDNQRLIRENRALIMEINAFQSQIKQTKLAFKKSNEMRAPPDAAAGQQVLQEQRETIQKLRARLELQDNTIRCLEAQKRPRSMSRGRGSTPGSQSRPAKQEL